MVQIPKKSNILVWGWLVQDPTIIANHKIVVMVALSKEGKFVNAFILFTWKNTKGNHMLLLILKMTRPICLILSTNEEYLIEGHTHHQLKLWTSFSHISYKLHYRVYQIISSNFLLIKSKFIGDGDGSIGGSFESFMPFSFFCPFLIEFFYLILYTSRNIMHCHISSQKWFIVHK